MKSHFRLPIFLFLFLAAFTSAQTLGSRPAQTPPAGQPAMANSDPTYQQLRNIGLSGEVAAASNLVLKRDAGVFTFRSGNFYFLAPVNGKVTGAVFLGNGSFALTPPLEMEKRTLALLTKEPGMTEGFNQVVLRFTDGTYDEIRKTAGVSAGMPGGGSSLFSDVRNALRKDLHWNLTARLLQDVLSPEPGGFFAAFIRGEKYSGKLLYVVDPHGAPGVAPEEVALSTYDENKFGIWAAFHYSHEHAAGMASGTQKNAPVHIEDQKLDTVIEKSGKLNGSATTTFVAQVNGLRVVPFDLFPTLRVESVSDVGGGALAFIQENKDEDADFAVILPRPLAAGERYTLRTVYSGKDAVSNEGGGNYYPVSRSDWYPNTSFGDYATYEMTFRIPKGLRMVASGTLDHEVVEGSQSVSQWHSEVPQAVAGFNFGRFKRMQAKVPATEYEVESYANEVEPDIVKSIQHASGADLPSQGSGRAEQYAPALGTMSTTGDMMKKALGEAQLSIGLYTQFFGPAPYKRVAMTQQTAFNYGQSWPTLVYMPISAFFDSTTRHGLGMDDPRGYFKVVGPHEVAHQWWGHTVGFNSYRDQWMSEGFAELSASLFVQQFYGLKDFLKFWDDERWLLTQKNAEGYRAVDVGPVTQGYRLATSKSGFDIPRRLIYPKGAYILHMLRMMLWDSRNPRPRRALQGADDRLRPHLRQPPGQHRGLQGDGGEAHDPRDGPAGQRPDGLVLSSVRLRHGAAHLQARFHLRDRPGWRSCARAEGHASQRGQPVPHAGPGLPRAFEREGFQTGQHAHPGQLDARGARASGRHRTQGAPQARPAQLLVRRAVQSGQQVRGKAAPAHPG